MSKISLTNLANQANDATAVSQINANSATIQAAFDNTLSRDGTSPNQMTAALDMNSNRILNLPAPTFATDVVRLQELSTLKGGGTVTNIPAGGNTGDVLTKTSGVDYAIGWASDSAAVLAGANLIATGTSPVTLSTTLTPTFTTVNKVALTAPATGSTLTIADGKTLTANSTLTLAGVSGKTLTVNNSIALSGVDGTVMTFPISSASVARIDSFNTHSTVAAPPSPGANLVQFWADSTNLRFNDKSSTGVVGTTVVPDTGAANNFLTGIATTGGITKAQPSFSNISGTIATSQVSGAYTIGALTVTTVNGNTFTAGTGTLTIAAAKTLTVNNSLTLAGTDGTVQTFPSTTGTVVTSSTSAGGDLTGSYPNPTLPANTVTNAKAAQMAAFTIKGNATGSTANATDISIPALTQKASPVAGDMLMIVDSAASNALKFATVSSVAAAGSVSSIAGNTGAFTLTGGITNSTNAIKLALNNATFQSGNLNPTATTGTTAIMMGVGSTCTITPVYSGRIFLEFKGAIFNSGANTCRVQTCYGTGSAPANGGGPVGTVVGPLMNAVCGAPNQIFPWASGGIVTGLTPGTAYWFDLQVSGSAGTTTISNAACSVFEF